MKIGNIFPTLLLVTCCCVLVLGCGSSKSSSETPSPSTQETQQYAEGDNGSTEHEETVQASDMEETGQMDDTDSDTTDYGYTTGSASWEEDAQELYQSSLIATERLVDLYDPSKQDDWTEEDYDSFSDVQEIFTANYYRLDGISSPAELEEAEGYLYEATDRLEMVEERLSGGFALVPQSKSEEIEGRSPRLDDNTVEHLEYALDSLYRANEEAQNYGVALNPEGRAPDPGSVYNQLEARVEELISMSQAETAQQEQREQKQQEAQTQESEALEAERQSSLETYNRVVSYTNPQVGTEVEAIGSVRHKPQVTDGEADFWFDSAPGGPAWEALAFSTDASLITESLGPNYEDYVHIQGVVKGVSETDSRDRNQPIPLIEVTSVETIDEATISNPNLTTFQVLER